MDLANSSDDRVKVKESEKQGKYLDLARKVVFGLVGLVLGHIIHLHYLMLNRFLYV